MPTFIRNSSWHEVAALFPREADALRNARGWADRYGVTRRDFRSCLVSLEAWTAVELADVLDAMSEVEPRVTVDMVDGVNNATLPPRLDGLPAVFVKFGDRYGIIDGKHRCNRWKFGGGPWAVLVIHA